MYREGACSKAQIAELTSMSPATVTRIVSELLDQGLVTEDKIAESTGGRKPVIFRLNYEKLYIVGVELVRDRSAFAICNLKAGFSAKRSFRPYSLEPSDLVAEIAREFDHLLSFNEIKQGTYISGSVLAIVGHTWMQTAGRLLKVGQLWDGEMLDISGEIENALGFPVVVDNDANAACTC